jgi:signal peptidase I
MTFEEELEKREQKKKDGIEFLIYVAALVFISFLIVTYVGQRTIVSGDSMNNTLSDGDNLIIDKITYKFRDPKRFEIVVFPDPTHKDTFFIKRIIGLPGEEVFIDKSGRIYINNIPLQENYGKDVIKDPGRADSTVKLGDDEYFVLGDNRNNSLDSRFDDVGNIKKDDLIGRAWIRLYPFSDMKKLLPADK